ncbi:MAG TPA: response regulator [Verrucomicrobiae bacterium]|nr:response regulator [Verrucomicrobiae bacterium]
MSAQILLVEDDENDIFFLEDALRKVGIVGQLQVAKDGREAINYLNGVGPFSDRKEFPLPSVVLLDLKLPYVMGLEVLKWIRQSAASTIPVIILSASKNETDVQMAYKLGANAYLVKPQMVNKLLDVAKAIKDFWLNLNILPSEIVVEGAANDSFGPCPRSISPGQVNKTS